MESLTRFAGDAVLPIMQHDFCTINLSVQSVHKFNATLAVKATGSTCLSTLPIIFKNPDACAVMIAVLCVLHDYLLHDILSVSLCPLDRKSVV